LGPDSARQALSTCHDPSTLPCVARVRMRRCSPRPTGWLSHGKPCPLAQTWMAVTWKPLSSGSDLRTPTTKSRTTTEYPGNARLNAWHRALYFHYFSAPLLASRSPSWSIVRATSTKCMRLLSSSTPIPSGVNNTNSSSSRASETPFQHTNYAIVSLGTSPMHARVPQRRSR
jgi:hypothetical protein